MLLKTYGFLIIMIHKNQNNKLQKLTLTINNIIDYNIYI